MAYTKKVLNSLKEWQAEIGLPSKNICIMCGESFETQKKLSKHQYYNCTGKW